MNDVPPTILLTISYGYITRLVRGFPALATLGIACVSELSSHVKENFEWFSFSRKSIAESVCDLFYALSGPTNATRAPVMRDLVSRECLRPLLSKLPHHEMQAFRWSQVHEASFVQDETTKDTLLTVFLPKGEANRGSNRFS